MRKWFLRTTLGAVGSILIAFLLARLGLFVFPRSLWFFSILSFIVLSNLYWWAWVDGVLAGPAAGVGRTRPGGVACRVIWAVYLFAVLAPFPLVMIGGRDLWDASPVAIIAWTLVWHLLITMFCTVRVIVGLAGVMGRMARRRRRQPREEEREVDLGRRAWLARAAAATPLILTGASVAAGAREAGRFRVRRVELALGRLPDRLRGLTITHLSDLHVGRLFRPEHLPAMIEGANRLDSDLVAVTGDIIDHDRDFLPAACDAIRQLTHRYGRFVVIGNHDLMDRRREVVADLEQRSDQFHYLSDRLLPLIIDGETIQVAGLFWSRHTRAVGRDPGHVGRVKTTLADADPDCFTLGLVHHPHAWDALADAGVDLTLAGHTHGGQLMLPRWATGGRPCGVGNLLFRYLHGEYRRGGAVLTVNAGVGNWFPVRLNAPAEIVQIRLV